MVIKHYKLWENTRGDGVQEEDNPSANPNSKLIVGIPSGEVIKVEEIDDFKELMNKKLIKFSSFYNAKNINCYICDDKDISKVKYLLDDARQRKLKTNKFKPIAIEFRDLIKKITGSFYTITYDRKLKNYTAIIPDLNAFELKKLKEIGNICTDLKKKYEIYNFYCQPRNYTLLGLDYLRIDEK